MHRLADPRVPGDVDTGPGDPVAVEQAVEHAAGHAARQVNRADLAAQPLRHPRDIDAAAARIVAGVGGADLARRADLWRIAGTVDGRVRRKRDDGSAIHIAPSKSLIATKANATELSATP